MRAANIIKNFLHDMLMVAPRRVNTYRVLVSQRLRQAETLHGAGIFMRGRGAAFPCSRAGGGVDAPPPL